MSEILSSVKSHYLSIYIEYAEASIEVAKECQVSVLDVWSAFMKQTVWKEEGPLPGSEEAGKCEILAGFLHRR